MNAPLFPLVGSKSQAELQVLAGPRVDAAVVRDRLGWLLQVERATQQVFAFDLVSCEPEGFHATLAAVQATAKETEDRRKKRTAAASDVLLSRWEELEALACKRKLLSQRTKLMAVCKKHGIHLRRHKKGHEYKFAHQEALTVCTEPELCALLAADGLARARVVRYDAEVPPEARVVVAELLVPAIDYEQGPPKRAAK